MPAETSAHLFLSLLMFPIFGFYGVNVLLDRTSFLDELRDALSELLYLQDMRICGRE